MLKKKLFFSILLLVLFFGLKADFVNAQTPDDSSNIVFDKVSNAQAIIADNTPTTITTPLLFISNLIEGTRTRTGSYISMERIIAIQQLDTIKKNQDKGISENTIKKPFVYLKLYLATFGSIIFNIKFIFDTLLILIFVVFIRFLWRKFF